MNKRTYLLPVPVLVSAFEVLTAQIGLALTVLAAEPVGDYALAIFAHGPRSKTPRRYIMTYFGGDVPAHRLFVMSILLQTGKVLCRWHSHGRAAIGTRQIAYFGLNGECQILWSQALVRPEIERVCTTWTQQRREDAIASYPETPLLVLHGAEFPLQQGPS